MMVNDNVLPFRPLFLVFSLFIYGARSYVLQEIPQAVAPSLSKRVSFLGGWAVYTPGACPDQTVDCHVQQYCCPINTVCSMAGDPGARLCCPDQHYCGTYVLSVPACANTSWSMYSYGLQGQFCCQPGQVGLVSGVCIDIGVAVASTALAISVVQITGTVDPSSAAATSPGGGNSAAATSPSGGKSASATSVSAVDSSTTTQTAAEGIHTPTTAKSSSESTSTGDSGSSSSPSTQNSPSDGVIGGIIGGVVGGIIIIALLVYLAFSYGRKRGTRGSYTSNHYGAPVMVEETKMTPPTSINQSVNPQKYDSYKARGDTSTIGLQHLCSKSVRYVR